MRIALIDTYYDAFLRSLPPLTDGYDAELSKLMDHAFGASFYSENLRALGHECIDIIANYESLQMLWLKEHDSFILFDYQSEIACRQLAEFRPDVIFLQDLSLLGKVGFKDAIIAAQCSCAFTRSSGLDVVFTSLPNHVEKFRTLGVPRVEYLPLAFEPSMLKYASAERDIDISCCAGVGKQSHWARGTDVLEAVAERFGEMFQWYGYGPENLPADSALRKCYRGSAWGVEQYRLYGHSKLCVNRHGEIAAGFTNNLRCYEAQGMGAMLLTEESPNLRELFPSAVPYDDAEDLCSKIEYFLGADGERDRDMYAKWGQDWVLRNHTYAQRMPIVSRVLSECLESRRVAQ